MSRIAILLALTLSTTAAFARPPTGAVGVVASVLPSSRTAYVSEAHTPVTASATMINPNNFQAKNCGITANFANDLPAVSFWATGSTTIAPGGYENYTLHFIPHGRFDPSLVFFDFHCSNTYGAVWTQDVNTFWLSAETYRAPDIIAMAATIGNTGVVDIPLGGTGVFAVATSNVGSGDFPVHINISDGKVNSINTYTYCQTNEAGNCIYTPVSSGSLEHFFPTGSTASFAFFVANNGTSIPLNPSASRIIVRFTDSSELLRGQTSVAMRTVN